ncbi:L-fucose:H+ symporter permease [Pseudoalteromonas gelatinilytica]
MNTHKRTHTKRNKDLVVSNDMLIPFILVAALFPLWGFANDITNPLVKAFKDIFLISNTQSSLVQFAFYLGYGVMAIPAALFIRRFSYKYGIVLGLGLYAAGALLFIPASMYGEFNYFLAALCTLTCGLALLETTANPYILSMGSPQTATKRLNLAQAFNPLGSLLGMFVASNLILNNLHVAKFRAEEKAAHPEYAQMLPSVVDGKLTDALQQFAVTNPVQHQLMQSADLVTIRTPYVAIALVVICLLFVYLFYRLPNTQLMVSDKRNQALKPLFIRLINNKPYREGVVAQVFYVGAQIMCWTFIIHYGMAEVGLSAAEAQHFNIIAMFFFLASRFLCTYLLNWFKAGLLLMWFAIAAASLMCLVVFIGGEVGLYSLVATSACMSLMFPTIYGIALNGLKSDASIASAGLVMAIVGGALMPPLQGMIIDANPIAFLSAEQASFLLPMLCFVAITIFAYRVVFIHKQ